MRKIIVAAAILAAFATSGVMAADLTAKGAVKSMDAAKCTVTLADGHTYQFAPKCDFSKLKANENVTITYTMKGTTYEATKVESAG